MKKSLHLTETFFILSRNVPKGCFATGFEPATPTPKGIPLGHPKCRRHSFGSSALKRNIVRVILLFDVL